MAHTLENLRDLTEPQRRVLQGMNDDPVLCAAFYFTGGTALKAVGIVPRISNDIDFFTFSHIPPLFFTEHLSRMRALLHGLFGASAVIETERGFLHTDSGTVVDCVQDTTPNIDGFSEYGTMRIAGLKDMAAHKASALCSRDEVKDYVDIAFLTHHEHWSLADLAVFTEEKFHLGTMREEKLLTELIAKRTLFTVSPDMFLRESSACVELVERQIAALIDGTTV